MKLLLTMSVPYFPAHGGANTSNRLLFESMVRRGHDVKVIAPFMGVPPLFTEEDLFAEAGAQGAIVKQEEDAYVFVIGGIEIHAVKDSQHLRRYLTHTIERWQPHFTVVSTEDPSQNLLDAAIKTRVPVIYMARTTSFLPFGPQAYFPGVQRARLLEQVRAIVTVSDFVARYVKEWSGLEATSLPISLFGEGSFPELGNPDAGFITMVNPCAVKGIDIFLGLARAFPDLAFAAVPTWGTTAADRAALAAQPNVTVLQAVTDIDVIFRQTRVVLVPSLWAEAKSRTIVEAMLRGIPVLASDAGGNAEAADSVLPVRVVERFTEQLDDNLLPVPVIPEQELGPWIDALSALLGNRDTYLARSQAVRKRALNYIAALDASPLEAFLESLRADSRIALPGRFSPPAVKTEALAPKADAKDRLSALSPEQQALLMMRLKKKKEERASLGEAAQTSSGYNASIPRAPRDKPLPLSFAQQRLWFLAQLEPDSPFYNIPMALNIRGALDIAVLQRVLEEVVRRHEALRTTFAAVDGTPQQIVNNANGISIHTTDLSGLTSADAKERADRLILEASRQPFDLGQDLPLRVTLIRLAPSEHVLTFTMHHIVADGWSAGVLIREVVTLYTAFLQGEASPLAPLALQYADFAAWQRGWLTGAVLDAQLAYWKERLAGAPALLELPTDHPRPAIQGHRGRRHRFSLGEKLATRLRQFSRTHGVTLYMSLLSAFNVLLSRYSGQTDICVGTAIANRNRAEVESLIGFFVNTLVMRSDLSGDPDFATLLKRTERFAKEAYSHQDLPFEQLVEALSPARSLSHSALIQVYFVLEPPARPLRLPGLEIEKVGGDNQTAQFDLTLQINDDEALSGELHYSTELFEPDTIARMERHLKTLLSAIVDDASQRISTLPLMDSEEAARQAATWNATQTEYPVLCVHTLFEQQVRKTPTTVAVICGDQSVDYATLDARANRLAHELREKGVAAESIVGVCCERSLEMVVGVLGILKAGAAYLPLDPDYPLERLAFIAREASLSVIVADKPGRQTLATIAQDCPVQICDLDCESADAAAAHAPIRTEQATAGPDNLAYVLYTSGSTGRPKGVSMTHRALCNLLHWQTGPSYRQGGRCLQLTSLNFDVSFQEIFATLTSGGALVIAPAALRGDMEQLAGFIAAQRIERLFAPYVVLQHLAEVLIDRDLTQLALREIVTAGEQLKIAGAIPALFAAMPQCSLANQYGPTEAHVVTECLLPASRADWPALPTIGKPIANLRIHVLDTQLCPVPVGVPGELYIAGAGLARGYLHRPDLTAERFVPDPFASGLGQRMYRSGDKARYLPDGSIEFLGRLDDQVKIRGFRIELGEIEAALQSLPEVRTAAVIVREDTPGDKRLVAYVETAAPYESGADASTLSAALREQLGARLPEYMLPSAFVFLEKLPVTTNGKLDRRALPAPDYASVQKQYVAPRNLVEEKLVAIWAQLLKLERVGVEDNFFDLGGHSLLATQAMSRLRQTLEIELPLRALFEGPTVAQLARRIQADRAAGGANANTAPAMQPVSRDEELPLSFAQQRLWFLAQLEPDSPFYNMPAALRLRGELDVVVFWRTLDAIVARHEVLRTCFATVGGEPIQTILPAYHFADTLVDLSALTPEAAEQEAARLAQLEAVRPFALERDVPVRVSLLKMNPAEHIVLFTMHHIASDGWSLSVLIRELAALYAAFAKGEPSPLPPLAVQYADFAHWQRNWLRGEVLQEQLDFWKTRLQGAPAVLTLPTDFPRPSVRNYGGASQAVLLDAGLSDDLKRLCSAHGATLYMLVLAAYSLLLARHSGQTDISVGTAIANRTRGETEGLIGFFVNTLVMRNDLSGDPHFLDLLARVRDGAMEAYAHQDLPFEQLVEAINPRRNLTHSPLFQVSLVLQNTPVESLELPGVKLSTTDIQDHAVAKFDLTLYVVETEHGIRLNLGYNTSLFRAATVARMVTQLETLLRNIVAAPRKRISELSLLSQADRQWLLGHCNDTARAEEPSTFHKLFEAQCLRTPDAPAVRCHETVLTYGELNHRAERLAHLLRAKGVMPDACVGLLLERSADMLIGVLGILKAGGAYVPLSADSPQERLALQLSELGAPLVVTQADMVATLPSGTNVLLIDRDMKGIPSSSAPTRVTQALPANLAYVIHTSGSTGRPKGVAVTHANLVNYSRFIAQTLRAEEGMQFATVSTLAADLGNTAIFPALMAGACVHVIDQEVALDGARFTQYMREHAIDVLKIVPSHLSALLPAGIDAASLPRKAVVLGGEALPVSTASRLAEASATLLRLNHYGPTETTVGALTFAVPAGYEYAADAITIPIGRPIDNVQAHVMSADGLLVPVGVPGELFIGGAGVARGYLGQAAQTAERFVPDPFGPPGSRLYRTGDQVRRLADGSIEFLGRVDEQIKIRGFRIEPGEVESALASHPAVRAVTVQTRPDAAGDKCLIAYVVADPQVSDETALRQHVRRTLPDYMIPAQFVFIDSIPLTSNGKIDRGALPEPGARLMADAYVAPRSALEEEVADIWRVLLKREQVGINDNFFELGGHSLLATQMVSRIREAFHVSLSLRSIFAASTVAEIAALVEEQLMEKIASLSDEEVDAMLNRIRRTDQEEDPVSA